MSEKDREPDPPDPEDVSELAYDPARAVTVAQGENLAPEVAWTPNFPRLRRLDAIWHRGEMWLCGIMFLVMGLLVFAQVVTASFGTRRELVDLLVLFGLVYIGTRTRVLKDGERRLSHGASVAWAATITAALAGLLYAYTEYGPRSLVWAQKVSLVAMLWVSLLGASLATYERAHLALELGEKLWPRKVLHLVNAGAHAVTSAFCVLLFWLSMNMLLGPVVQGQNIEPLTWLPKWTAIIIMPYAFGAMAVRMAAQTVTLATGTAEPKEEQLPT
jgi:TRAP-type C4-dicarboxylate transport system permease small subunit